MIIDGVIAKLIKDFPDYSILRDGRVYSFKTRKFLSGTLRNGYVKLTLLNRYKPKTFVIHRLVAQAFIPNPENKPEVNHIDGNKLNNHVSNLEWCTRIENYRHAVSNNLAFRSPKIVYQYDIKGNFIKEWDCLSDIQRELGFNIGHISNICNKKHNKKYYKKFIWTYEKGNIEIFDKKCVCGKDIPYKAKVRNPKYCSESCYKRGKYKLIGKEIKKCEICCNEFSGYSREKYCSQKCKGKAKYLKNKERLENLKLRRFNP
jgi:hypothetical protein